MKSTKYIYQLLMVLLLAHFPLYAQYTGGSAGTSLGELTNSICGNPAHFYAYFGGSGDGSSIHTLTGTSCGTPPGGFAYLGGNGHGGASQTISTTSCGLPPGAFAYTGGNGDGQGVHTLLSQVCPIPPQFYAYFGAEGSGAAVDKNRNCAIVLPVADFSASPTTACVNTDVTFTNLSTDAVAWEWTFTGGTVVAPSTIYSQNPVVRYATAGTYAVTLKALNEDGNDIETKTAYITIGATATITATTPGSRCGAGSVTIGATSGGIVRWYAAATGGTLLGTGATFTTPSISINTTYYAEAYNGCVASSRTAVLATINTVPTITGTPASRCGAGVLTLSANPSAGTVSWYDAANGGNLISTGSTFTTPNISVSTTYYAETTTAQNCISTRIPVVATINTVPTIIATTPASRCGSGVATLGASTSAGTISWFAVATGGIALATGTNFSPNVIGTTTYYIETSANGCTSARTPVTLTVNSIPTIVTTSPGSRCDSGVVTLGATASAGTLSWYNAPTGGILIGTGTSFTTPSISTSTNYYVETNDGTCTSPRTSVLATINITPSITSTTPSQVCGSGIVTLSAFANAGSLNWYSAASGGSVLGTGNTFTTPSITETTTFYVEAVNTSCTSARIPIIATVNTAPTITSTTPASRCGAGSATLQAASSGSLAWYASATGGSALGIGTNFTPSVVVTTTYYVDATANGCTSVRIPVTITINEVPTITTTSPGSRCDAGEVTLAATASAGTLSWYNVPTAGTLLGTGNSFTTPSLSGSTNYYVETNDGTCTSSRTAVLATINVTPSITSTSPSQVCGSGTVTLSAFANAGQLNWYNAASGGSVLGTGNTFITPSITETTTFYVEAVNNSCTSVRVPVLATVNMIPTITSTTDTTICANETGTLSATASAGTIYWYSLSSGGIAFATGNSIPVSGASATFYVEAVSNGCTSARVPVSYTSLALPMITSVNGATRCDAGSLTLSAVSNEGTISWFDVPSGGTALGTGSTFATPDIAATTTYYVEATNGTCTSTRTAVTASIIPTSAPTGFANQTFCEGESVGLLHVEGVEIQWYDAPTSGNLLADNTLLVAGTTYYASQTQTGCESPTRLAITVSLGNCLGTEGFEMNALQLYPNPTFDVVNILSNQPISKVALYNMLGQHIQSTTVNATEAKLDLSAYAAGAYFVKVTVDHQIKTYKVIKK
ncbi:T9SS type A sorting domain-containing protein [Flavobacterium sp. CYK-4]|uniref:Ig-like domain-containing protein n=1 Tax=Flavobacterium lotistagni TaxID=2709660 RepID=UPI00140B5CC8|nr:T9SS type A sorting domain-containing protein [Flavobacterium lotistagni]NHM05655.1 T9SS type A sorting domain-containing protein [Flavobacterium lotistagni]